MKTLKGNVRPLGDKVFVCDMEFGMETSSGGIVLHSDDGKSSGVHPRWARVFAIGPDQHDVAVGEWILLEHGRWSREIPYETNDGAQLKLRLADIKCMLLASNVKPSGATMRQNAVGAGSNVNFNIPSM